MSFSRWNPHERYLQDMTEQALRFAPPESAPPVRLTAQGVEERKRPPLVHALDKPVEQLLAEELAYYETPV